MCTRCFKCLLALLVLWLVASSCTYRPTTGPALDKAATLQRVDVSGGSLEYSVRGEGEPVLLIHGSVYADVFENMVSQPVLSNFQLITYHRRGYAGSTRATAPFTLEQQAADVIALLDRIGAQRAHLVGHSYGGSVALQVARQYPRRVASMVLLEAAVPAMSPPDPKVMEGAQRAGELYGQGNARGAIQHFSNVIAPGSWEAMTAAGATAMQEQAVADAGTFFEIELPALTQWQFGVQEAGTLQIPALVVVGGNSAAGFKAGQAALLRALPLAQEKVIDGVGHALQMEQPAAVAQTIAEFIRKHPAR